MKEFITIIALFGIFILPSKSNGQYIAHYTEKEKIKSDTLIDKETGVRFIIDKKRIFITALDKNGKIIWKSDPVIDNKIEGYRVKRPTIVYFAFGIEEKREIIAISYNNSQFGYLDKKTGYYHFVGQD